MIEWQPIETAPTHGKPILVGFQGQFEWFYYVAHAMGDVTGKYTQFAPPTHWQPLPVPPAALTPSLEKA